MEPTIGRIVYYKTRGSADDVYPPTIFAAIITAVGVGDTVSLATFGVSGLRFETNVARGQDAGQWDWMPFQKDQQLRAGYNLPIGSTVSNAPLTGTTGSFSQGS